MHFFSFKLRLCFATVLVVLLGGCATPADKAPVEDRKPPKPAARLPAAPASATDAGQGSAAVTEPARALPGAENAGKPGYYTVKPGDTMIRIGLDNGQNWRDVVRWNAIDNPNLIEVGQVLRVVPPNVDAAAVASRSVVAPKVDARPLDARPAASAVVAGGGSSGAASAPAPAPASATAPAATPPVAAARDADDDVTWSWPSLGAVATGFEEGRYKGLAIIGKAGDPVLAAADGRVVYAGSGLRGYGNLVIVKHNNTYLTAYAHNQALMVKEDQAVRRGQKIAEMGASDADRVQLHFEIRRLGKPIDPAKLLPTR